MLGFILGLFTVSGSGDDPRRQPGSTPPDHLLEPARCGDDSAREELIRRYTPLVLRVGAQVSGRYVQVGRDEEVSVGLMALSEAIDHYDAGRGASFVTFAEMVIRRRLVDLYRREGSRREVPLSELTAEDDEGNLLSGAEEQEALVRHAFALEAEERREEIQRYSLRLASFGIRFGDLVEDSPRHADARERAMECARVLVSDPTLVRHVLERRELPLKVLETRVGVSRKTLERQRRYIIAVAIILLEDFCHLRQYIKFSAVGGREADPTVSGVTRTGSDT